MLFVSVVFMITGLSTVPALAQEAPARPDPPKERPAPAIVPKAKPHPPLTVPDPAPRPPTYTQTPTARPAPAGIAANFATTRLSAGRSGGQGEQRVAPDQPIPSQAALANFYFSFQNGDHKFRVIKLMPDARDGRVVAGFADQNDDDVWTFSAEWWAIAATDRSAARTAVFAVGARFFDIELQSAPGYTPAIRGFVLERKAGTDANVRSIGVQLLPIRSGQRPRNPRSNWIARLELSDDASYYPGDALELSRMIRPPDAAFDTYAGAREALSGSSEGTFLGGVQIAWIPDAAIQHRGTLTGGQYGPDSAAIARDAIRVLSGFRHVFLNSDHHMWSASARTGSARFGLATRGITSTRK